MLNIVALMGRLTADPELKSTPSGISVCRFTLAVERNYAKQGEERQTDFINCLAWRGTAEFISRYFIKGQLIAVDGSIQTGSYTDNNGNKKYTFEVVANNVNFTGDRRNGDANGSANKTNTPTSVSVPILENASDFSAPDDDDLLF